MKIGHLRFAISRPSTLTRMSCETTACTKRGRGRIGSCMRAISTAGTIGAARKCRTSLFFATPIPTAYYLVSIVVVGGGHAILAASSMLIRWQEHSMPRSRTIWPQPTASHDTASKSEWLLSGSIRDARCRVQNVQDRGCAARTPNPGGSLME